MKVLSNTLKPLIERWEDPGDYPSAAGSCPMPSYDYFAGCEGTLVLELTPEEVLKYTEDEEKFLKSLSCRLDAELPSGVKKPVWSSQLAENRLTLQMDDCEGDPPEHDYEPLYDY